MRTLGEHPTPLMAAAAIATCLACSPAQRWNVLLVTFDTTRADHLACYGHPEARTPNVDGLAAQGVLFRRAVSSVPITLPSHATILTGKYPLGHGIRDNGLFVLAESNETLAEILSTEGYATAAAVGGFPLAARFGLTQGFDLYDDRLRRRDDDIFGRPGAGPSLYFEERRAAQVAEALLPWLRDVEHRPFFAWMHFYDPHQPLDPPPPYDQLFADPYLGEIAYADEVLGRVLEALREAGEDQRTLVVFTADHGEGRGQHGESTHSFLVYQATQHVPLILRVPDGPRGVVVEERVGSVDIAPTILDLLGVAAPAAMQGSSLVGLFEPAGREPASRPLYAETLSPRLSQGWGEQRALLEGGWKYIHGPRPELYHLDEDPGEVADRLAAEPERAADMRRRLEAFLGRFATAASVAQPVDDETRAKLEALGYIAASAGTTEIGERLVDGGEPPQDRIGEINSTSRVRRLLARGEALAALDELEKLLARDPDNLFYLETAARADAMLRRWDSALARLDRLRGLGAGAGAAGALLVDIGNAQYLAGRVDVGIERVRQSVELGAGPRAAYLLALMLQEQGLPGVDERLRQALDIDPAYAPARIERGIRLAQAGRAADAEAEFVRALSDEPYSPRGHYNQGAFLLHGGRVPEALSSFRRAIELDGRYGQAYYGAILAAIDLERVAEAKALYAELAARAPASAEVERARALLGGGP